MSSHVKIFGAQDEWGEGKAAASGILTDRDEYFSDVLQKIISGSQ